MSKNGKGGEISRRQFLRIVGATAGVAAVQAACRPAATPTPTEVATGIPTEVATAIPEASATPIPTPTTVAGPRYGGTLTTAQAVDIAQYFPFHLSGQNWPYFNQLFNLLVRYDENLEPQPELAESWEFSEDGLALTFHLREGVLFHNGREFEAEDVVWTMERVKDEARFVNIAVLGETIESVEAKDRHTAVMHFSSPSPGIFDFLDLFFIMAYESFEEMDTNPIGTGPFKFVEWIPGEYSRWVKFEDYWREGRPYLDEVVVRVIPDIETQLANLETGQVTMLFPLPTIHYHAVNETPGLRAFTGTKGAFVYNYVINCNEEPFTDKRVRQAMQWASDREKMLDLALGGIGEVWLQPVPSTSLGYNPELEGYYTFDLDRAKDLITEAGYPNGFELEIMCQSNYPEFTAIAEILQDDLAKIGVNAWLNEMEAAAMRDRRWPNEYGWQFHPFFFGRAAKDPTSLYGGTGVWKPEGNLQFYYDSEYERLVYEGATTMDTEQRREIYHQLARIVIEDSFSPVISPRMNCFAVTEKLKDLKYDHDDMMILEDAWLEA